MQEFYHNMNRWIWNRNNTVTTLRIDKKVARSLVFRTAKLIFVSQPEHCYLSSGFSNFLLFELISDGAGGVSSMVRRKCFCMAIFTLEKDYSSETGYPLDNSRQIDKTSWFENMIRFLHQMETREKNPSPRWDSNPRSATEVRGFESHLGLGFFPEFPLMPKTYHVLLLILLVLQKTVSRSYIITIWNGHILFSSYCHMNPVETRRDTLYDGRPKGVPLLSCRYVKA